MTLEQRKAQFNKLLKRYLVVVDLEATCTNKNEFPSTEMETIEFGAVVLDRDKGWEATMLTQVLIKPILHPKLTEFCTELTTITQEELDSSGASYQEALTLIEEFTEVLGDDWSWCSWGAYDRKQLVQDGMLHSLNPLLPPEKHFNMKAWFSSLTGRGKQMGLAKAVNLQGLEFQGTPHRALSDALNVAEVFKTVV